MQKLCFTLLIVLLATPIQLHAQIKPAVVEQALKRSVDFYIDHCAKQGGYVWRYSRDLTLSEGEAETPADVIWVQPPGTPAVGEQILHAYEVTGQPRYLAAALTAADALIAGQLQSGGWYYSITFDPDERQRWGYRGNDSFRLRHSRKNKTNITTLDDDTTPAALRFLMQVDRALDFKNARIHDACLFALDALIQAQHPAGGWSQNWDRHPSNATGPDLPILPASYPDGWSREWGNDWTGKYYLNDNVMGNMVSTLLLAWDIYADERYLNAAKQAGEFLLLAQMPAPQPAWAQQYNEQMHPVWDRKFEPPAIASDETQETIATLLELYAATGDAKFLAPVTPALRYLKSSLLPDGQLARFYELQTNHPLYFKIVDKKYLLTYDDDDLPTHYAFKIPSKIESLTAQYKKLRANPDHVRRRQPSSETIERIIGSLDKNGAWIEAGNMKGYGKASPEGVIESNTFVKNVRDLCDYLQAQ